MKNELESHQLVARLLIKKNVTLSLIFRKNQERKSLLTDGLLHDKILCYLEIPQNILKLYSYL